MVEENTDERGCGMDHKVQNRIEVEEARSRMMDAVCPWQKTEQVELLQASGRILAEDVFAVIPQPPFDRSPLDGYALHGEDTKGADRTSPVVLPVVQEILAGTARTEPLPRGTAARIMTGAPLPEGANAVIRQEDTNEGDVAAAFYAEVQPGQNVCFCGEDQMAGDCLIKKGTRLAFSHIGILAAQGKGTVTVYSKVKVAVMATGDELVSCGKHLGSGQIYDSNAAMLAVRLKELGAEPVIYPAGNDDVTQLSDCLEKLLSEYALVVTTGGVSVGKKDCVPEAAVQTGADILFHGVLAKPGSPVMGAVRGHCAWIALSGNPFACVVMFELLMVPVLAKIAGETGWKPKQEKAILVNAFLKPSNVRRFIRADINGGEVTIPENGHFSGGIGNLAACNCFVDIPAGNCGLNAGDEVKVWIL